MAISLAFGLQALRYPIGQFSHAGPGLFPLMVSCMLFLVGVATVVRSRFTEKAKLEFNFKNIALILSSLAGFSFISAHVNMIAGIVFMVFWSAFAGSSAYSVVRNLKIATGLVLMALVFQKLLGLNLPLY